MGGQKKVEGPAPEEIENLFFLCPSFLSGPSVAWMVPAHTGEGRSLYSV